MPSATLTAVIDLRGMKDLAEAVLVQLSLRINLASLPAKERSLVAAYALEAVELVLTAMKTTSSAATDQILLSDKLTLGSKVGEINVGDGSEPRRIVHEFWEAVRAVVSRANSIVYA